MWEKVEKKTKVDMIKGVAGDLLTDELVEDIMAREAAKHARTSFNSIGSKKVLLTSASHVPVMAVLGKTQLTPCQHMKKVKTVKNGWGFGWEGTREGALHSHPEAPGTLWYHLLVTGPTSPDCHCLRLVPVPDTDSVSPAINGSSLPFTTKPGTLISGKNPG